MFNTLALGDVINVTVDRVMKPIQIDAFLIEWHSRDAKTILDNDKIVFDAAKSRDGLCCYFSFLVMDSCTISLTGIIPQLSKMYHKLDIDMLFENEMQQFIVVDTLIDSFENKRVTMEMSLPWSMILSENDSCNFECGIVLEDMCDSNITHAITFKGERISKPNYSMKKRLILQVIFVLALLVFYMKLRKKVAGRKKGRLSNS